MAGAEGEEGVACEAGGLGAPGRFEGFALVGGEEGEGGVAFAVGHCFFGSAGSWGVRVLVLEAGAGHWVRGGYDGSREVEGRSACDFRFTDGILSLMLVFSIIITVGEVGGERHMKWRRGW